MLWFTSDNHFYHWAKWTQQLRPFSSVSEMNEEMIKRYNTRVKPTDTCIFVGDFSFGNSSQTKEVLDRLNGFKILVVGNHDKKYHRNKFDLCVEKMTLTISGVRVTVKHYPLRYRGWLGFKTKVKQMLGLERIPRYLDRMPKDIGGIHIHGHTHSTERFNKNQIHVGVDAWGYAPVSCKELTKYIRSYTDKEKRGKNTK